MAQDYSVSRMTIRQAISELDKDGLVMRRQGAGTFIEDTSPNHGRVTVTMEASLSVSQALIDMGYNPEVLLIRACELSDPPGEVVRALRLGEGETVAHFQRNFVVDGKCVVVTRSYLPNKLVEGILDNPLEGESIQRTLYERYGYRDELCQRWIEAIGASDEDAELLGVDVGSPLILLTSLFFDYRSLPIDYVRTVWPGDSIRIFLEQRIGFSE
ncbi:MAG: GntR family transcriptional regulator [Thermomicrobiales bacterium]|nr:GntR family transcriptional regulator [Thermomicrobiales bacterium]